MSLARSGQGARAPLRANLALHIRPRRGDYGARELTPKRLTRFRAELERAGVGTAIVMKAMAIIQPILSFAVSEELVEYNPATSVARPRYRRAREPQIFLHADVEKIRPKLGLRNRTLVSVLGYSRPRAEEVVWRLTWDDVGEQAIRYADTKATAVRFTQLFARLPKTCASAFSSAAGQAASRRCSPPTAGSGSRTIGATGAGSYGMASRSPNSTAGRPISAQDRRQR